MNCKCLENAAQKLLDKEIYEGRNIIDVQPPNLMWVFGESGGESGTLSYEDFEVELEGLKKPKKVKIAHTFCPYCGKHAGKMSEEIQKRYDANPIYQNKTQSDEK